MLQVKVNAGLFRDECEVRITTCGQFQGSVYVNRSLIQTKGSNHFLKLSNEPIRVTKGVFRILLPTEIVGSGSRWLQATEKEIIFK
jgi:hypothetical protein